MDADRPQPWHARVRWGNVARAAAVAAVVVGIVAWPRMSGPDVALPPEGAVPVVVVDPPRPARPAPAGPPRRAAARPPRRSARRAREGVQRGPRAMRAAGARRAPPPRTAAPQAGAQRGVAKRVAPPRLAPRRPPARRPPRTEFGPPTEFGP